MNSWRSSLLNVGLLSFQAQVLTSQILIRCNPKDMRALQDFMSGLETVIEGWSTNFSSNCYDYWTCNFSSSLRGFKDPSSMGRVVKLELNSLKGHILEGVCDNSTRLLFDISSDGFTGIIPDVFHNCSKLQYSLAHSNSFTGSLPISLTNSPILTSLNLRNNLLKGQVDLNYSAMSSLLPIDLGSNRGLIPLWLSHSNNLQLLDFSWNCLSGKIPMWDGNFGILFYMDLSNNSLSGEIPKSITGLRTLVDRNISLEETTQYFPFFLKSNLYTSVLQYNQLLRFPPTLDLSFNNLRGPIWQEFGNLKELHVLDLKFKKMAGAIPSNLSELTSLDNLDLSHNKLSGTIPPSLEKLSFLSKLNVADNQLHGEIPSGGQFLTFTNASFQGNNLCCDHHASPCASKHQLPTEPPNESGRSNSTISSGYKKMPTCLSTFTTIGVSYSH
ncbi:hypothetical protein FNV43_RR21660 [Rhamnella rubrinervis]|uniref:Uncharacterized protein n=1 Tax=Rhamnella rubrinervis TaxID=2594499 RepID=A0A8K0GUE4_9ROSA|nr:hypothetical protein FNV43_RR21660 [Rhamnella rubrinervis]